MEVKKLNRLKVVMAEKDFSQPQGKHTAAPQQPNNFMCRFHMTIIVYLVCSCSCLQK